MGRYSFLTADPFEFISARGNECQTAHGKAETNDPFALLTEHLDRYRTESIHGFPPFQGGAAGLFSYDLAHHLERLPRARHDEFVVPDMAVGFYDWVLAFDHGAGGAWIISTGMSEPDGGRRRQRAEKRLRQVQGWLATAAPIADRPRPRQAANSIVPCPQWPVPGLPDLTSNFDRPAYLAAVRHVIEYIHAGDCFQVNLAQRLLHPLRTSPVEVYRRLREHNPATFSAYFDLGPFVICSASPERFVRVTDGEVETRPIKGTRPRGHTPAEDMAQGLVLLNSAKDRAENIMIVDLLRNDLGRVCDYGSVHVPAVCRLETYPFVHHLVSEVRGRLRPGLGPVDLLRAAFPGGSVTGAPKIRAMQIIAELEPTARGPYCGSLGYIGFDGAMDTSILIRTMTIGKGWVQFPVGGGIVADSTPEQEYEETWHKAPGLLRALQ